jgi:hypothetical protein
LLPPCLCCYLSSSLPQDLCFDPPSSQAKLGLFYLHWPLPNIPPVQNHCWKASTLTNCCLTLLLTRKHYWEVLISTGHHLMFVPVQKHSRKVLTSTGHCPTSLPVQKSR